jgi:hypothetical protein
MGREGALAFGCWFDNNIYEEDLVKEWVTEITLAARHFLVSPINGTHPERANL